MRKRSPHKGLRSAGPGPRPVRSVVTVLVGLVVVVGCGQGDTGGEPASREMTQAQRDSVLAESRLPGAGVVGRALEVADSAEVRSDRLDNEFE